MNSITSDAVALVDAMARCFDVSEDAEHRLLMASSSASKMTEVEFSTLPNNQIDFKIVMNELLRTSGAFKKDGKGAEVTTWLNKFDSLSLVNPAIKEGLLTRKNELMRVNQTKKHKIARTAIQLRELNAAGYASLKDEDKLPFFHLIKAYHDEFRVEVRRFVRCAENMAREEKNTAEKEKRSAERLLEKQQIPEALQATRDQDKLAQQHRSVSTRQPIRAANQAMAPRRSSSVNAPATEYSRSRPERRPGQSIAAQAPERPPTTNRTIFRRAIHKVAKRLSALFRRS